MKSLLQKVISVIFLFLLPHRCVGCNTTGSTLCKKCIGTIPAPERDLPRGIYALYDYRDPLIKKALWNLKYGNVPELATVVAPLLYENIIEILAEEYALLEANHIVVVPIPTSGDKTKKRTYNHAYKIAQAVVEYQNKIQKDRITTPSQERHPSSTRRGTNNKWQLLDPLIKIKKTQRQAMVKGRAKRIKNIEGAYGLKKVFLSEGRLFKGTPADTIPQNRLVYPHAFFIIIDDITTTGASINEAMRALKPLNPRHMFGITIAH